MTEDEINEKIKQRLHSIFPSPEVAERVVDSVVRPPRPEGWSHRSNAPYFKEIYAVSVRKDVDRMLESGMSLTYRYDKWCGEDGMSENTLYNRINQSVRYLVEKMDTPDRKYYNWYQRIRVERRKNLGVVISFIPGLSAEGELTAEITVPSDKRAEWRRKMDAWLESDNTTPFIQENLTLSAEEIRQLKIELAGLTTIEFVIKPECIKIIKMAR